MGQPEFCNVRYSGINRIGKGGKLAKTDIKNAFRLLRVSPSDFDQLGFSFDNKFYFDKCLLFGASISCSLFEKISTALHWFTDQNTGNKDCRKVTLLDWTNISRVCFNSTSFSLGSRSSIANVSNSMPRNVKISVGSTVLSSATGTPHNLLSIIQSLPI
jgi:hypothetical protein